MVTGLIIGKFLPPHRGHAYLVETARSQVDRLVVMVCSLREEPIPGERRVAWMREMFPDVDVRHLTDENPSEPHEHPRFWELWTASIRKLVPEGGIDAVFSSEGYGEELAGRLGARHVMVDRERRRFPVSGRQVREDPMRFWAFLPECVRPEYVRRVVVTGPESTGKTTLARRLADELGTAFVPEFARAYLDAKHAGRPFPSPPCDEKDIPVIARGQVESEERAARAADRVVVCDTDLYVTCLYSEEFFGSCPSWIRHAASSRRYDLHLLLDVDVPWIADPQRDRPHRRARLLDRLRTALERDGRRHILISGSWQERRLQARLAVSAVTAERSGTGPESIR